MHFSKQKFDLHSTVVFLDVDGTLVADKEETLSAEVLAAVTKLSKDNEVYLASNGKAERAEGIAKLHHLKTLPKLHKPLLSKAVKTAKGERSVVVIGDKFLTDGVFALLLGARFLKVDRIIGKDESTYTKGIYALDDLVWGCVPYISLLRPYQWIKNLLVFSPLFFAGALFVPNALSASLAAFAAFCLAASAVYVLNDIFDREQDKEHPKKQERSIASGRVSVSCAYLFVFLLSAALLSILWLLPILAPVLIAYAALNVAYSAWFKHIAILDILCVAVFYIMRVFAGGAATGIAVSNWLIVCVFFLSLFIIVGKRRAEFRLEKRRKVLAQYSKKFLDGLLFVSAALAVAAYGAYTIFGNSSPFIFYTTIFVAAALFRVINRLYTNPAEAEVPEKMLVQDPWILGSFALWGCSLLYIFYVTPAG
ncbi:UbiA family prenyltransferase [Patescibacteria group bacterium]|nr:UbiA family prenyltransferase [Patescibacteria group bacterium]